MIQVLNKSISFVPTISLGAGGRDPWQEIAPEGCSNQVSRVSFRLVDGVPPPDRRHPEGQLSVKVGSF